MHTDYPIHDLYIRDLDYRDRGDLTRLPLLEYDDHLLRRFGYAEFIRGTPGLAIHNPPREVADEVWVLLEGTARFTWKDTRDNSPTVNIDYSITSDRPILLLVPFGVAFGYQVEGENDALLIRLATHPPDELHPDEESVQGRIQ
jgi:hypothetical protein